MTYDYFCQQVLPVCVHDVHNSSDGSSVALRASYHRAVSTTQGPKPNT